MNAWFWVWFVLAAVLSLAELFSGGFFLLPFGIGAGLAAAINLLGVPLAWQWVAFLGGSFIALFLLRRFAEHITPESPQQTGGNRLIGKRGVVIERLEDHGEMGRVRVDREEWRADAPGFEPLEVGTAVTITRIEGTHLIVEPTDSKAEDA